MNYQTVYYKEIRNVNLKIGVIDKLLGFCDIYFDFGTYASGNRSKVINYAFFDIENPYEIYPKVQKNSIGIQTDIEYPNALRTEENPGYNTKYNG